MTDFDDRCGTISLVAAAQRLGVGRSLAYDQAHRVDENGRRWLCDGVPVLVIGSRFRVPTRPLERALGEAS